MIRHSFEAYEKVSTTDKSVAEQVRLRDTSPRQAAQAGIDRVAVAIHHVFSSVQAGKQKG